MASMDLFEEWRMDDVHNQSARKDGQQDVQGQAHQIDLGEASPMFSLQRLDWSVERCAPAPPPTKSGLKRLPKEISKAVVVNHLFVFGTTDGSILRWNMEGGGECDEVELSKKPDDNIKHIFVDPSGHHVIAALKNGESYYLHSRSSKAKKISKLQGSIESVGFDKDRVTESSTKSFLVGTSTGRLYEMVFESNGKEKVCQLVHQLDESSTGGITSIYFETFSSGEGDDVTVIDNFSQAGDDGASSSRTVKSGRRIFILCTTSSPTRLYHFLGGPSFSQLFHDYKLSGASSFVELPGSVERSELMFCKQEGLDRSQSFAMLTKQGIYHGSVLLNNTSTLADEVLTEAGMTAFAHRQHQQRRSPISVQMTEFHFLLLYADALVVQSRISGELQQEENLFLLLTSSSEDSGEAIAMVKDAERNAFWLITTTSLFQIEVCHEDRLAWQMYLDKAVQMQDGRLFDTAHQFCKSEVQRKKVHRAQADFFLVSDQIEKAATQFALAGVPFDEVLLLLLTLGAERKRRDAVITTSAGGGLGGGKGGSAPLAEYDFSDQSLEALRLYLREKLRILPPSAKSQKTMIATWLCEIFLHTIASAATQHRDGVAKIVQEFKDFLRKNRGSLDNATTMSLLLSRGQAMRPLLLFYSQIIGDYDKVVSHYINENMIGEAISVLKNAPIEKVEELIYKKAPILMARSPELAVELFLSKPYLAPTRLLPALFRYSEMLDRQHHAARQNSRAATRVSQTKDLLTPSTEMMDEDEDRLDQDCEGARVNFAIYYLKTYLVNAKERERSGEGFSYIEASVQHALIWLLAKYDDDNESGLLELIVPLVDADSLYGDVEAEVSSECLLDRDSIDISYVLRECKRENRTRSCVYLYVLMNVMEKAVAAALEIDLQLAKNIARRYQIHQSQMDGGAYGRDGKSDMMLSGVTGAAAVGKKLWLRIIEHVVLTHGKGGVSQVLQMLHDSNGLLRIEDILEQLPDFTEIDLFKEEICNTLEDYATRIETLKSEMDELSSSAETIDKELAGVTTRGFAMRNHQRCEGCSEALQTQQLSWEQFYLFPCGHGYHEACLLKKSGEYLEHAADIQQVASLKEQISAVSARAKDADKRSMVQMEHLQAELDGLVAADCPLCGDYMIRSTGLSLLPSGVNSNDLQDEAKSWEL